jgi:hypothetical protein
MTKKARSLKSIAKEFFGYLGRHFPQQCASDEFYFLPRAESAIQHLNVLDDFDPEKIQDHIRHVQALLSEIGLERTNDLEKEIDRQFLRQSMAGFIREFDEAETWRDDPTLYVKVPLFATDHAISQTDHSVEKAASDLSAILAQIPPFLGLAIKNLRLPSAISVQVALNMAQDAVRFYSRDIQVFVKEKMGGSKDIFSQNIKVLEAWEQFKQGLHGLPTRETVAVGEEGLKKILAVSLGYPKSPREILKIAQNAYRETEEKLNITARRIGSRKTWIQMIKENYRSKASFAEVMRLFRQEVKNLRHFIYAQDIITLPPGEQVRVFETPAYLLSLRATASYKAPFTGRANGLGRFYITPGRDDLGLIASHCPYLSAHETYPGHHILDHLRLHHPNPIRRQIESPLFYEGWACYAEQLLDDSGYIQDPRQQMIGLKRQLWRNLRAALDVELQTGKIGLAQAAKRIEMLGFPASRARRQARRFCLTPGYQLCYFMGMHEMIRLRERFSSKLGPKVFHDTLLGGGEIPFHLVEKRMAAASPPR